MYNEERAEKTPRIDLLTITNRVMYASRFRALINIHLTSLKVMPIADGTIPFPTRAVCVNANGDPDPRGAIPPPAYPAAGAVQAAWLPFNAVNSDIDRLTREREAWEKREQTGLQFLLRSIGQDVERIDTIVHTVGSLPLLYAAIVAYTRKIEDGDIDVYNAAYTSFTQQQDEYVEGYTVRFLELVEEMNTRGWNRPLSDNKRVFAAGLIHKSDELISYSHQSGVTFAMLKETAISIESSELAKSPRGQFGSSVVLSNQYSAHSVQMARAQQYHAKRDIECNHCGKRGHSADDCWVKNGKPSNKVRRSNNSAREYQYSHNNNSNVSTYDNTSNSNYANNQSNSNYSSNGSSSSSSSSSEPVTKRRRVGDRIWTNKRLAQRPKPIVLGPTGRNPNWKPFRERIAEATAIAPKFKLRRRRTNSNAISSATVDDHEQLPLASRGQARGQ